MVMSIQAPASFRSLACVLLLLCGAEGSAQQAFGDSLTRLVGRATREVLDADKHRVALVEFTDPGGTLSATLLSYVEESMVARLVATPGITVVERRQLDRVIDEQRRTATGVYDEGSAIELGRLLAADAIITGRLFPLDKRLQVMIQVLDTETGVLLSATETITSYPNGFAPRRADKPIVNQSRPSGRMDRESPPTERSSILEFRAHALGGVHYDRPIAGGALEIAVRARQDEGGKLVPGKASIGLQASFFPNLGTWAELPYDVGRIVDLQATPDHFGTPGVRMGGVNMSNTDLFLMDKGLEEVEFDEVENANDEGIIRLEYDRNRLSNMQIAMVGFNLPVRWYLGDSHMYDNVPKVYLELGFGMDLVLVRANYEVTTTVLELDPSDFSYVRRQENFVNDRPAIGSMGSNLLFTHFSVGGGVELGRFNLFALGRFISSSSFTKEAPTRSFDRVRGNILAFPALAGAGDDPRAMSDLARDGALLYGALDLERERTTTDNSGNGSTTTTKGNGVDMFWQSSHLLLGLSYRLH